MNYSPAGINPYVGLRAFEEQDSLYFFGRRQQTAQLLEQLHDNRFLAVVGRSGCGKSSLVRAGLIPALRGGFLVDDRDRWHILVLKPGSAPLHNLALALSTIERNGTANDLASLEECLQNEQEDAVIAFLEEHLEPQTNVLLLVDQFEEIFGFRGSQDSAQLSKLSSNYRRELARRRVEAASFMDILLALPECRQLPIYVSLTMRSDFLGDCDVFHGLPDTMNRSRYLVPRLDRSQLREAIQGPALLSGAAIAPSLLDTVINDLSGQTDKLPVLQHALYRTWNAWHETGDEKIDLAHYDTVGRLTNALSIHADEALQDDDVELTRALFQCLTDTDPEQRRIRRPVMLSELVAVTGASRDDLLAIIDRFKQDGRHFLIVSPGRDDEVRIEISHESLIRQWQPLRQWIDEERISRDHFLDLVSRARRGRALLTEQDLHAAGVWQEEAEPTLAWAKRYSEKDDDFSVAMAFLKDSQDARQREIDKAKRFRFALRSAGLAVFALMIALTAWALQGQLVARQAEQRAISAESEAESLRQQTVAYAEVQQQQLTEEIYPRLPNSELSEGLDSTASGSGNAVTTDNNSNPGTNVGSEDTVPTIEAPISFVWANRRIVFDNVSLNGRAIHCGLLQANHSPYRSIGQAQRRRWRKTRSITVRAVSFNIIMESA